MRGGTLGALVVAGAASAWIGCGGQAAGELPPPIAELDLRAVEGEGDSGTVEGQQPGDSPAVEAASELLVAFSLGDKGSLQPCDCPEGASGGLARQATFAERLAESTGEFIWLAGPGSLQVKGGAGLQRLEQLAALQVAAGVGAFGLGSQDVAGMTPAELDSVASSLQVPCIATNLGGSATGPVKRVLLVGDQARPVALLSILDRNPRGLGRRGFQVLEPTHAVQTALATLPVEPAAVIALCDARPSGLEALAAELPEVDFLVGASGPAGDGLSVTGGVRLVRESPGTLRLGILELIFSPLETASLLDSSAARNIEDQRLGMRWSSSPGDDAVDRQDALDRDLEEWLGLGHVYGYLSAALPPTVPMHPEVQDRVNAFTAAP